MPLPFHRRRLDPDAADFCRRSGATDRAAINAFVRGVKDLGLWDNMVCWPLRSAQNAGFGSTAYSLGGLGTYDGTLVNFSSGAWTADGVAFDRTDDEIQITATFGVPRSAIAVGRVSGGSFSSPAQGMWCWGLTVTPASGLGYSDSGQPLSQDPNSGYGSVTHSNFNMLGVSSAGSGNGDAVVYVNGSQAGEAASNAVSESNPRIGRFSNAFRFGGTISIAIATNNLLSATQHAALNTLYKQTLGAGLGLPDYDPATIEFASRSGATDLANIDAFVRGVKDLGLWDSMVCWPLRSSQNAGSGTTAYSLGGLGTYDGTLVNTPAWGADGITVTSSATITDGYGAPLVPASIVVAGRRVAGTGSAAWQYVSSGSSRSLAKRMYANNSAGLSIAGVGYTMQVDNDAQTLSDDFEVVTGIVPTSTNSEAEVYINTTKPAQTAGATSWGASASTGATLSATGDGQFEASMHAVFSTAIDATAFYTLYRNTLGTGLGLP